MTFRPSTLVSSPTIVDRMAAPASSLRLLAVVFVAALTAAASQVSFPLPFTPVPFTLQPALVLLGGAVLGARLGASAQALYLALGLAGLPVFAFAPDLPQGLLRLLGPSGGYLMAYPLAAFVTGAMAERGLDRRFATSLVAMVIIAVAIVAYLYLNVATQTAAVGRQIQSMQVQMSGNYALTEQQEGDMPIEELVQSISDLEGQLALLTSYEVMEARARELGLEPALPEEIMYLVVPGYQGQNPVVMAPPPEPVIVSA